MAVYYRTPHVVEDDVSFTDRAVNKTISDILQEYSESRSLNEAIKRVVSLSDYYLPADKKVIVVKAILGIGKE